VSGSLVRARRLAAACALGALALGAGCKKQQPPPAAPPPPVNPERAVVGVKVTDVQLGKALGADKRVTEPLTSFAPKDTVFASVVTEGSATAAELTARWTFQDGQLINETKRSIAPGAKEVTEFSIQKPDGWPPGTYKVEILLDGKPADSKSFTVQ
jgi:Flp pilus assembly protein CpaB